MFRGSPPIIVQPVESVQDARKQSDMCPRPGTHPRLVMHSVRWQDMFGP